MGSDRAAERHGAIPRSDRARARRRSVKSAWENEQDAHAEGRPARRYYKLTAPGVKALAEAASFYRALLPAGKPVRG